MPYSSLIPFEWPSLWRDPESLRIVEGTTINCLLLPEDVPAAVREKAEAAGLKCPPKTPWRTLKDTDWNGPSDLIAISDAFWPELSYKNFSSTAGTVQAGPTGEPWLDANGWLIEMARCRAPGKAIWIKSPPPENAEQLTPDNYILAQLEAATYGATRPLWLAPEHAEALAKGNPAAVSGWKKINATLAWLKSRRAWASWKPFARLAIVSTYSGDNEYTASEVLNLAGRRNLSFVAIETSRLTAADLEGRKGLLYVDKNPLSPSAAALIQKFVESGGTFICLKEIAAALRAKRPSAEKFPRFEIYDCGKGKVAAGGASWDDPWILAQDSHLLLSRRWDAVRLFNAGSLKFYHSASPDGRTWLVQILNYTRGQPAHKVSLQTWQTLKTARLYSPGQTEPTVVEIHREPGQQELWLPPFPVYLAVELELDSHA
jgi:hypothetical protein